MYPSEFHRRVSEGLLEIFDSKMPNFAGPLGMSLGVIKGFLVTNITKAPEDKLRAEMVNLRDKVNSWLEDE